MAARTVRSFPFSSNPLSLCAWSSLVVWEQAHVSFALGDTSAPSPSPFRQIFFKHLWMHVTDNILYIGIWLHSYFMMHFMYYWLCLHTYTAKLFCWFVINEIYINAITVERTRMEGKEKGKKLLHIFFFIFFSVGKQPNIDCLIVCSVPACSLWSPVVCNSQYTSCSVFRFLGSKYKIVIWLRLINSILTSSHSQSCCNGDQIMIYKK